MKLLAWDTSSKTGALAAIEWEPGAKSKQPRLVSEWTLNVDTQHSERLLWAIHELLESARWKLDEIDAFGVGVGPGSFTGLRIGITTARTLAHAKGKPLVGVSSLAALARPVSLSVSSQSIVIATTDACKGELFALWGASRGVAECVAMAQGDFPGLWKRGVEERVLTPDELIKRIQKKVKGATTRSGTRWIAVGEGRNRYPESWALLRTSENQPSQPFSDQVQGRYVALLAWEGLQAGLGRDALLVHPRYVRASDAELKLKAKARLLARAPE